MEQPSVQVPAELVMGPRCDLWADPEHFAAFERASTAAEHMTAHDSCMISARRTHRGAIHAWAEQTGRTWRQARALIPSRRPYWPKRARPDGDVPRAHTPAVERAETGPAVGPGAPAPSPPRPQTSRRAIVNRVPSGRHVCGTTTALWFCRDAFNFDPSNDCLACGLGNSG